MALDHVSRLIKTPKLLGLLPDEIFKALQTISIINPDDSIKKGASLSELEIKIKRLQEKKEKGKLSKRQKQELIDAEREQRRRKEKRKERGLDKGEKDEVRKKILKSDNLDPQAENKRIKKLVIFIKLGCDLYSLEHTDSQHVLLHHVQDHQGVP